MKKKSVDMEIFNNKKCTPLTKATAFIKKNILTKIFHFDFRTQTVKKYLITIFKTFVLLLETVINSFHYLT